VYSDGMLDKDSFGGFKVHAYSLNNDIFLHFLDLFFLIVQCCFNDS